jgi:hypothetical protein
VLLQRSRIREKLWVTSTGLTRLARRSSTTRVGLAGLAKTAAWIDEQIGLTGLAGWATRSRKHEVPVGLLTQKAWLCRIWLTRRARLQKI